MKSMPIETAPKDGTFVLLLWQEALQWNGATVAHYESKKVQPFPKEQGWYGRTGLRYTNPTHWMPLPEEPI